jgi:hypothetical protein
VKGGRPADEIEGGIGRDRDGVPLVAGGLSSGLEVEQHVGRAPLGRRQPGHPVARERGGGGVERLEGGLGVGVAVRDKLGGGEEVSRLRGGGAGQLR